MSRPRVLIVLTSHDKLGDTGKPTGWYLPEFAHPYHELKDHCDITIASPKGGKAPLDPGSVEMFKNDEASVSFHKDNASLWENTRKLSDFTGKSADFEAIFYVGGHGPMFDLAVDQTSIDLIKEFSEAGKIVSAVCHGPSVFVNVKLSDGESILKGQECTGFTDSEEKEIQLDKVVPFLLETKMRELGGNFKNAPNWGACVCVGRGGKLITGQNPASATPLGKELLKQLGVA